MPSRRAGPAGRYALLTGLTLVACSQPEPAVRAVVDDLPASARFAPLGDAIGDAHIVLLGENGHGVGSMTDVKVDVVRWLHEELGFELVVFESGMFECGHAERTPDLSPRDALHDCLRYPFQHAELLPLFDRAAVSEGLGIAGMDPQAQGYDSGPRPAWTRAVLEGIDPELASAAASLDSLLYLVPDEGGLGDELFTWTALHADSVREVYAAAAESTAGWERQVFRLADGWVERVAERGRAEAAGAEISARYYELRDEWMARAVAALADSVAGRRRVVVWLHNDHARYGRLESPSGPIRSTGGYLREWYGDDVFSIGVFMGAGEIADNGRNVRSTSMAPDGGIEAFLSQTGADVAYSILRGSRPRELESWATAPRPYLRMGLDTLRMTPREEFDALLYVDTATVPSYDIPIRDGGG